MFSTDGGSEATAVAPPDWNLWGESEASAAVSPLSSYSVVAARERLLVPRIERRLPGRSAA